MQKTHQNLFESLSLANIKRILRFLLPIEFLDSHLEVEEQEWIRYPAAFS